jgi:transposase
MKRSNRKGYPTDVSDEEWSFAAPYLTLMDVSAPQRKYKLREMFDAIRWIARAGAPWRMLPNDFPPWELVYQQTQRWLQAGCFENMVCDLRSIIRVTQGRQGQPSAVILDGRTLQPTCESGPRAGCGANCGRKQKTVYSPLHHRAERTDFQTAGAVVSLRCNRARLN